MLEIERDSVYHWRGSVHVLQLADLTGSGDSSDDRDRGVVGNSGFPCFDVVEVQPKLIEGRLREGIDVSVGHVPESSD